MQLIDEDFQFSKSKKSLLTISLISGFLIFTELEVENIRLLIITVSFTSLMPLYILLLAILIYTWSVFIIRGLIYYDKIKLKVESPFKAVKDHNRIVMRSLDRAQMNSYSKSINETQEEISVFHTDIIKLNAKKIELLNAWKQNKSPDEMSEILSEVKRIDEAISLKQNDITELSVNLANEKIKLKVSKRGYLTTKIAYTIDFILPQIIAYGAMIVLVKLMFFS